MCGVGAYEGLPWNVWQVQRISASTERTRIRARTEAKRNSRYLYWRFLQLYLLVTLLLHPLANLSFAMQHRSHHLKLNSDHQPWRILPIHQSVRHLLMLCLCVALPVSAHSKVVGAAVIPHGDFAYDPALLPENSVERERANAIHAASVAAGQYVDKLEPDIIVLSTPHGVALDRDFALFTNTKASGYALVGGDLIHRTVPEYKVPLSFAMDPAMTTDLLHFLQGDKKGQRNVSAISSFADSEPQAIRWGEVVPLSFVSNKTLSLAKIVLISLPTRRYTETEAMVPELLDLGAALFRFFEVIARPHRILQRLQCQHATTPSRTLHRALTECGDVQTVEEKVVVVASSDLAHTHLAAGPYGFSKAAAPFDAAVGAWAAAPDEGERWLVEVAAGLAGQALSCGFPSLVLLHGLLRAHPARFAPRLLANLHPTYYGMLVATF